MRHIAYLIIACGAAFVLASCASFGKYDTPTILADGAAVATDLAAVNADILQGKADYNNNKAALPADAAKLLADQKILAAAVAQLAADIKAAGGAPPTPAPAVKAALAANIPTG